MYVFEALYDLLSPEEWFDRPTALVGGKWVVLEINYLRCFQEASHVGLKLKKYLLLADTPQNSFAFGPAGCGSCSWRDRTSRCQLPRAPA